MGCRVLDVEAEGSGPIRNKQNGVDSAHVYTETAHACAYIHACLHTCLHYLHTCLHTHALSTLLLHTCVSIVHIYVCADMHTATCVNLYMHARAHTHNVTYAWVSGFEVSVLSFRVWVW